MMPPKIFAVCSSTKVTFAGPEKTGASLTLRTRTCTVSRAEVVVASLTSYSKVSAVTLRSVPLYVRSGQLK